MLDRFPVRLASDFRNPLRSGSEPWGHCCCTSIEHYAQLFYARYDTTVDYAWCDIRRRSGEKIFVCFCLSGAISSAGCRTLAPHIHLVPGGCFISSSFLFRHHPFFRNFLITTTPVPLLQKKSSTTPTTLRTYYYNRMMIRVY